MQKLKREQSSNAYFDGASLFFYLRVGRGKVLPHIEPACIGTTRRKLSRPTQRTGEKTCPLQTRKAHEACCLPACLAKEQHEARHDQAITDRSAAARAWQDRTMSGATRACCLLLSSARPCPLESIAPVTTATSVGIPSPGLSRKLPARN